jgi:hypothetical protein
MAVEHIHDEEWNINIRPDPGEEWAQIQGEPTHGQKPAIQPDLIRWIAHRGGGTGGPWVSGRCYKKGGELGLRRSWAHPPQWALDLVDRAREARGWTDDYLREHGVRI